TCAAGNAPAAIKLRLRNRRRLRDSTKSESTRTGWNEHPIYNCCRLHAKDGNWVKLILQRLMSRDDSGHLPSAHWEFESRQQMDGPAPGSEKLHTRPRRPRQSKREYCWPW